MATPVIFLGIDAAEPWLVESLMEAGAPVPRWVQGRDLLAPSR